MSSEEPMVLKGIREIGEGIRNWMVHEILLIQPKLIRNAVATFHSGNSPYYAGSLILFR